MRDAGLLNTDDGTIWRYAARHGLTIVSTDRDFYDLALGLGLPPKVIWLRLGNCPTEQIEAALRRHHADLLSFGADPERSVLELS